MHRSGANPFSARMSPVTLVRSDKACVRTSALSSPKGDEGLALLKAFDDLPQSEQDDVATTSRSFGDAFLGFGEADNRSLVKEREITFANFSSSETESAASPEGIHTIVSRHDGRIHSMPRAGDDTGWASYNR